MAYDKQVGILHQGVEDLQGRMSEAERQVEGLLGEAFA